jgi:cellulose synthase/poly-beta-1,6-N-acetylglucosamine synthase-like glycosyltransferase
VGEAPDEVRGIMRQRSRWCKGHMQVFFSSRCPLFHRKLSPLYWVLYTNGECRCLQPTVPVLCLHCGCAACLRLH